MLSMIFKGIVATQRGVYLRAKIAYELAGFWGRRRGGRFGLVDFEV